MPCSIVRSCCVLVLCFGLFGCGGSGSEAGDGGGVDSSWAEGDAGPVCTEEPCNGPPAGGCPAEGCSILEVKAGRHHTCTRMADGSIYCWGQGAYRALGGDYNFQGTPRRIEAFADATGIGAGRRFGCAVRPGGAVWCWGENDHGQIGTHETIPCGDCTPLPECADSVCVSTPQPMEGLEGGIVEVALGDGFGCARRNDGDVGCWGNNSNGQVAHENVGDDIAGIHPVPGVSGAAQIVAGISHACALIGSPGTVMCWGANDRAQVGNGDTNDAVPVPSTVAGLDDAVEIIAGGSHTCARRQSGSVVCWGYNYLGSLGNGSTRPTRASSIQDVVGVDDALQLAAGQYFTCALRADRTLSCWGDNRHGQLGDGTSEGADCDGRPCRTTPVPVMVVSNAVLVSAGHLHACAASGDGRQWCWGYNLGGQLGTGGVDSDPVPVPVEVQGLP